MNSDNNKELFRFQEYGIDTSTKRKLVDAVKYLQSIGEDVSDNTIIRMNEHSDPCGVYKCLECSNLSGCWNGSPPNSKALPLSAFKKIYEEFSPIKVGDFISFEYNGFHYNGFVERLYDNGNVRLVSVYTQEGHFKKLLIKDVITPQRANPSNMKEIASKYNKFKNKDKMENRSKKKAFKTDDYVSLKLKNGRSVHGFVYRASPLNVAVASGKSFKLHLGVDSSKVSHQTVKPTPEFKKRYVSWLYSQDKPIIPKTDKPSVETKDCWIHDVTPQNLKSFVGIPITVEVDRDNGESIMFLDVIVSVDESFVYLMKDGKHLISKVLRFGKLLEANQYKMLEDEYKERLSRKTSVDMAKKPFVNLNSMVAFEALVGVPVSIETIEDIETFEENEYLGVIHNVNALSGEIQFVEVYKNKDFVNHKVRAFVLNNYAFACVSELNEGSALYNNVKEYYTAYLEASDTKSFKLDELNENQYVEISSVEEYKSYCEIANHLGLEWSTGVVYVEYSRNMLELWKKGEKIYMWVKRGCYVDADFIKGKYCELIPFSQIEKPTAIISGNEVTEPEFELSDISGEFKNGEHSVVAEQNPLNQMKNAIGRLKDTIVVPENEPFDKLEEFDPNKPFEVSDDGETWINDFTHYIGVCPNMNVHFVSKTGRYDSFNFIRNTPMIKVKRSEITGVITKDGTFKNFEIID